MQLVKATKVFVIKWVLIIDLILLVLMAAFFDMRSAYGLIVGSVMSIINFHLLALSLTKAVKYKPINAGAYVFINYILRYILWFAVFYIALKRPDVNLLTTVLGMLTVKIVITIINIFNWWPEEQQ
ncbi:ATP synthase subunit I [Acetohalobium arabaticum]|uniref:ATP synthase I n=1 Tax=Acetohalobium arabaticum (strain ATCC 49924 / DSM 5501 / Z-7288) TaxID=574087 RepID=D9QTY9_ACEAZ|nr:ATP synthase subunit I [Acetohalobium arabaticum]ADL13710.1 ATP synthase I [Acetohalobium arabaticum DSM 5501]